MATNSKDRWNIFVVVPECISWSCKFHFHRCALQPFMKERHGLTLPWLYVVTLDQMNSVTLSLTRSGPQRKMENSWTACKSKRSFLSCKAEFSAVISFKTCVLSLRCVSVGNVLISGHVHLMTHKCLTIGLKQPRIYQNFTHWLKFLRKHQPADQSSLEAVVQQSVFLVL